MNAKELFSAAIRVIGLLSLGRGINDLVYVFMFYTGLSDTSVMAKVPVSNFILGLFFVLVGLYFLRGAPFIMDFAFPVKPEEMEPPPPPLFVDEVQSEKT